METSCGITNCHIIGQKYGNTFAQTNMKAFLLTGKIKGNRIVSGRSGGKRDGCKIRERSEGVSESLWPCDGNIPHQQKMAFRRKVFFD